MSSHAAASMASFPSSSSIGAAAVPAGEPAAPGTPAVPEPAAAGLAVPEALREDQIANAVAFLSHPKVRRSLRR